MLLKPSQYEPFSREFRYLGREPRLYAASEERRVGVSAAHDAEARLQSQRARRAMICAMSSERLVRYATVLTPPQLTRLLLPAPRELA
jgi:hypothetical protein